MIVLSDGELINTSVHISTRWKIALKYFYRLYRLCKYRKPETKNIFKYVYGNYTE